MSSAADKDVCIGRATSSSPCSCVILYSYYEAVFKNISPLLFGLSYV